MKCSAQNYGNYKLVKNRTIALALLICFISVSLLSGVFILTHADHVHDHNGTDGSCNSCAQIQNAENILRFISTVAVGGFTFLTAYYAAVMTHRAIWFFIFTLTPITAKNRMNN